MPVQPLLLQEEDSHGTSPCGSPEQQASLCGRLLHWAEQATPQADGKLILHRMEPTCTQLVLVIFFEFFPLSCSLFFPPSKSQPRTQERLCNAGKVKSVKVEGGAPGAGRGRRAGEGRETGEGREEGCLRKDEQTRISTLQLYLAPSPHLDTLIHTLYLKVDIS